MPSPLNDLQAEIDALVADMDFVRLASQLRPRLGSVVQWQAQGEETDLARRFMSARSSSPEGVYGSLLVRVVACFERYLRNSVADVVVRRAAAAADYDELAETLGRRNLVLTGRLLATLDSPRDYLELNVEELVENLASCRRGNATFRLNPLAFSAAIIGVNPSLLEKALDNLDITEWWDKIGASQKVAALLGTKGSRATGEQAKERLKELARWRNHLAHGGDGELQISDSDLRQAIEFIAAFSGALDAIVYQH